jgi:hypothetical protein
MQRRTNTVESQISWAARRWIALFVTSPTFSYRRSGLIVLEPFLLGNLGQSFLSTRQKKAARDGRSEWPYDPTGCLFEITAGLRGLV